MYRYKRDNNTVYFFYVYYVLRAGGLIYRIKNLSLSLFVFFFFFVQRNMLSLFSPLPFSISLSLSVSQISTVIYKQNNIWVFLWKAMM